MSGIHVAVVDEHEVVRAGLEAWLTDHTPGAHVTGLGSQREYLDWIPTARHVDAVLTEIQESHRAPGLECLRLVCRCGPGVIVHSRLWAPEVILASIDAGAASYVVKSEGRVHLLEAVDRLQRGEAYVGPQMAEALRRRNTVGRVTLSGREREVLMAWLRTESKDEVGRLLHIAPATVRTHLQRIRAKYAQTGRPAPTKAALFVLAVEDGLIGLGDLYSDHESALV